MVEGKVRDHKKFNNLSCRIFNQHIIHEILQLFMFNSCQRISTCPLSNLKLAETLGDLQILSLRQPKVGPKHLRIMILLFLGYFRWFLRISGQQKHAMC